jgi:hypothetical protein
LPPAAQTASAPAAKAPPEPARTPETTRPPSSAPKSSAPATEPAATPAAEPAPASGAAAAPPIEPVPIPAQQPQTGSTMLWIVIILAVLVVCYFAFRSGAPLIILSRQRNCAVVRTMGRQRFVEVVPAVFRRRRKPWTSCKVLTPCALVIEGRRS